MKTLNTCYNVVFSFTVAFADMNNAAIATHGIVGHFKIQEISANNFFYNVCQEWVSMSKLASLIFITDAEIKFAKSK